MLSTNNKIILTLWLLFLLTAPVILWFLPKTFFDDQTIILCVSKYFFGLECLGCGITRAVMHFHHLDFQAAYAYNKLVWIVYPFLVGLWLYWIKGAFQRLLKN